MKSKSSADHIHSSFPIKFMILTIILILMSSIPFNQFPQITFNLIRIIILPFSIFTIFEGCAEAFLRYEQVLCSTNEIKSVLITFCFVP
jgi:hypothetical protein